MDKIRKKYFAERKYQSGATLVVIIITMLVVAIVGIALYSITDTSNMNQSIAQRSAKAYYLAESCVRLVASEYRNAIAANKNSTLLGLQGKTFSMPANQGQFTIDVSGDWLYALTAQSGTSITLFFPGNYRPVVFPAGVTGLLKLKRHAKPALFNANPTVITPPSANGTQVTFTFASAAVSFTLPNGNPRTINQNDEFYIGNYFNNVQTVNQGGNLVLGNPNRKAEIFPAENGTLYIQQTGGIFQYTYTRRNPYTIDPSAAPPATITFQNIQPVPGTPSATQGFPLIIIYNGTSQATLLNYTLTTHIYIGKNLLTSCTGTYGN